MAENETPAAAEAAPQQPQMRILGQFIRDMSFENIIAQKGAPSDAQQAWSTYTKTNSQT